MGYRLENYKASYASWLKNLRNALTLAEHGARHERDA